MINQNKTFFKKHFTILLLFLIYLFAIKIFIFQPIAIGVGNLLNNLDSTLNKNLIYYELIDNPLTFINLAEYYNNKGNVNKALLTLDYAELANIKYKSNLVDKKIENLRIKLGKSK